MSLNESGSFNDLLNLTCPLIHCIELYMENIDIQTIILILFTGNLVSLSLFIVRGKIVPGDWFYIWGRILQAAAWFFIGLHAGFFYFIPSHAGGVLLTAGFAAESAALLYSEVSVPGRLFRLCVFITALAVVNLLASLFISGSSVAGIESIIFSVPFFICGFIFCLWWSSSSRVNRFMGILNLASSIILLTRGTLFILSGDELQIPFYVHAAAFMVFFLLLAINSAGYILSGKELVEQSLLKETSTDYLTGISNRRGFESEVQKYISLARRISMPITLLMIDIDNFKKINHRFGHAAGDLFLKEFADTVSRILRGYDLFCRYGGEEFVVLLPNTIPDMGRLVADRIRRYADEISINGYSGLRCSVSIGISSACNGDEKTIDLMYDESETALYKAKKSGRNKVCVA